MKRISLCTVLLLICGLGNEVFAQNGKLKYPAPTQTDMAPKVSAAPKTREPRIRSLRGRNTLGSFQSYIGIGVISPNSDIKKEMTQSEYLSTPLYGAPLMNGKMGCRSGVGLDYMFYIPLNVINENMVTPHFDWGWSFGGEGGFISGPLKYVTDLCNDGTVGEEMTSGWNEKYWIYGGKIGPNLSWRPVSGGNFGFEVGFRAKVFFHSLDWFYGSSTDINNNHFYLSIDRSTGESGYDFCTEWAFALRWPYCRIFLETTKGFVDQTEYEENLEVNYVDNISKYNAHVNLNYLRFGIALVLLDASR